MAEIDGQLAEFSLWDGSTWKLRGWKAVNRWMTQIDEFWRPFESAPVPSDPVNAKGNLFGRLNDIQNRVRQAEASGLTPRDFAPDLASLINQAWGPCHPDSPTGQIVADALDELSAEAALFAFGLLRGGTQPGHAQNLEHTRGMLAAAYPGWLAAAGSQKRFAAERSNFREGLKRMSDAMDEAEATRAAHWSQLLAESTTGLVGWVKRRSNAWRDTKSRWLGHHNELIAQLDALEATYREKLSLMAPVRYWEDKAERHRTAEAVAAGRVRSFFLAAIPLMVLMFGFTGWYLITQVDGTPPTGLYIVVSAGLATTAGLMLWIGRLLTKLYLSQHHLRQDAEERAVMTTTYLALTAEQAASDADRTIILNALFRPTSDGIVKEDGGLDPSVAGLISRIGAR
ncbi:DUF6161 domain-containing protein [Brevundimonas sp. SL161]|uniref:DUF6161 domain-containing protein n=1 Tax=Brevundimonas sp. SL161 TaxID=2804613 RepID=UPI003CF2C330